MVSWGAGLLGVVVLIATPVVFLQMLAAGEWLAALFILLFLYGVIAG